MVFEKYKPFDHNGPFTTKELDALDAWWFHGGRQPDFIITSERWIRTVNEFRSRLEMMETT